MNIHKLAEDYLPHILMLQIKNGMACSIDIVQDPNYSKPSLNTAIRVYRNGCWRRDSLLPGKESTTQIYDHNGLLIQFLYSWGDPLRLQAADAQKIEHGLRNESYERIKLVTLKKEDEQNS